MNVVSLLMSVFSALTPTPVAPVEAPTVEYGLFGTLHLSRPAGAIAHTVLLFSDRDGWTARQADLGATLAQNGAFVVGIDLPAYVKRLAAIKDKCSYPAGHVEEVAHWIERHEGLAAYSAPLVVGDGAGATFAYALAAQVPAGTFEGLLTLGWDASLQLPKPLCPGDAGAMTRTLADGGARVIPVAKMPLIWWPRPFADGAHVDDFMQPVVDAWSRLDALHLAFAQRAPAAALGSEYARWRRSEDAAVVALPDDVADLPLTDIAPAVGDAHRIAIMLTGDGGWAGLDRGVADALTAKGVRVIGFSTLKFFWHKQSADVAADAIARVIAHYGKADPSARFVLIGYSFGASLVPVVINRLPAAVRTVVDGGVMISPDDAAVFEIHVGDWFGSTHHDDTLPIGPEIAMSKVPLVCVHGMDEDDSFCLKPQPSHVSGVDLPGGHHYDGDFAALGELIVRSLPKASSEPPKT
ncbi:MAG: AcvB/VirJ family lysyl-phosphatidylglycerol hydrolase [Dokdonella sp.]|uniref:AcvB/VirJ family lysyl-phosphatidylglycerol hydrolase n=1 Tax=Dokdonella sp. TaxID=2291710 RepID=UPI00326770C2